LPLFKHTLLGLAIIGAVGNEFLDMTGDPFIAASQ
jgi:hypothetical protein